MGSIGNIGNIGAKLPEGKSCDWKKEQPYIYWMTRVDGVGSRTIEKLVGYAGSPEKVYGLKLSDMMGIIPKSKAEALLKAKQEGDIFEEYYALKGKGIRFISIYHPCYPKRLKNIPDAPYGIYVEGKLPEENIPSIAVIGARQCSDYGRLMAKRCGRELALAGINVISGMAKGIDGISQWSALEAGGKAIAVLGCGTDICYPPENRNLYMKVKEKGAVISEYPPGTSPAARLFPRRNRIISGLADIVLIVEAREKSGTLITADMALEQGREVYVIPGRITDGLSQGCNQMIKQGAGIFTTLDEMLEETGLRDMLSAESASPYSAPGGHGGNAAEGGGDINIEKKILDVLDFYPKDMDKLIKETGMEYRELVCALSRLCLEGKAVRAAAGQFKKG